MPSIFTIGHSTHEPDRFLGLLRGAGIELVVDVRRFPSSRRFPWFNRDELERTLREAGIDYVHMEPLGGRRDPAPDSPNGGWRVGQFRGYADHMASADFAAAVDRLVGLARDRHTTVMCAEAQWWRCHRRLLSDALVVRGWAVQHVGPRGEVAAHALTEFAMTDGERLTYPPPQLTLG
jgi:uncharacterized protein (DUF488 family)